jgi:ribosomal protein S27AE
MTNERDALKLKLTKIKQKKTVDVQSKFCVNCGKDFLEKENFNWSCQIHRSEYGDHMWWCCGKRDLNAPGCKYQKHTNKLDS